VLNWFVTPDSSGATDVVAANCSQQSGGQYRIAIAPLPSTADGQREQLVRRLAARDSALDILSVDPPYTTELANAGWLYAFTDAQRAQLLNGVLAAPTASAIWKGQLVAAPFLANTQLLWYRKSVAAKAGVDPTSPTFTWDQMINAAVQTGTTIAEQGQKYEGYMVWINALVLSGGGSILKDNNAGRDATATLDTPAGHQAAEIIKKMATSKAAGPALANDDEEASRALFDGPSGGFLLNWPYTYAAIQSNVKDGSVPASVLNDLGWARYPRVDPNMPSQPPLGGVNLAVSKFSRHQTLDFQAIQCLTSPAQEKINILKSGSPVSNGTVYDDPDVQKEFPMALLMRESISAGGPRPVTPYYGDVSSAIQRIWHPESSLNPSTAPKAADSLITNVLHDRRLL
jgi:multiple sugar transport system substrate-binding protein